MYLVCSTELMVWREGSGFVSSEGGGMQWCTANITGPVSIVGVASVT